MSKDKIMSFRTTSELHKQIKIKAAIMGISIADYIEMLVNADLEKDKK